MSKVTKQEIIDALRDASSYAFYRDLSELADRIEAEGIEPPSIDALIKRIDECLMIYSLPAMHDKPVAKVLRDCRAALTKKYVPMTDDERNEMITVYTTPPSIDALIAEAVAKEREVCAKVVEDYCGAWDDEGYALAAAIRARGPK